MEWKDRTNKRKEGLKEGEGEGEREWKEQMEGANGMEEREEGMEGRNRREGYLFPIRANARKRSRVALQQV